MTLYTRYMKISKGWVNAANLGTRASVLFFIFNPRNHPSDWLAVVFVGRTRRRSWKTFVLFLMGMRCFVLWWFDRGMKWGKCIVFFFPVWFTAFLRDPGCWSEFCLKKSGETSEKNEIRMYYLFCVIVEVSTSSFWKYQVLNTFIYQWKGMEIIKYSSYSKWLEIILWWYC